MTRTNYAIAGGRAGKARLDVLHEAARPATMDLLRRVGVAPGDRCLDVGCGGGHVTLELARLVGPAGRVVGVDADVDVLALARQDAALAGIANARFVAADALALDAAELGAPFDVAYSRFLLAHLSDPAAALRAMASLVRRGGVVVVEDVDVRGMFCDPPSAAFDRAVQLHLAVIRARGGDAGIGPRLAALLAAAGISDIETRLVQTIIEGTQRRLQAETMELVAPALLELELVGDVELQRLIGELRTLADDPSVVLGSPRVFQVWGRVR